MKNNISNCKCFVDCLDLEQNKAIIDFAKNEIRLGKVNVCQKQINRIGLILATDLTNYAETGGDTSNLSADKVYTYLQSNQ
ncbi:MAG: hypothetical protein PHX62_03205 [Bacilli bacterium]|nr:hypothetical protein [Clostridia bacterium]MDD3999885.1 hypothetical protein [Bacilli bacterium]